MSGSTKESYDLKRDSFEPLAIIGMSCRFPFDANSLDKYWKLLIEQRTTASQIPEWRWQSYRSSSPKVQVALDSATCIGSFLSNIEGFDADFFGISGREAEFIDPQQRIILELTWEAFENAGIVPSSLKGHDVGVYIAANSFDYGHRLMTNLSDISPWTMNGGMLFGIANRISYALDFHGPSMVADTACAGSLTVLHLACQALQHKEIPLAIVGGVNVMSNPGMTIALDAAGATAKDGRSKAFDKSANGYGRGEGAGIIVLKRLSDAQKSGDRILALVKGSGIFQDGRTVGMMAPNPEAQETMLRKTYARYGILPHSVNYVEAHGTGTQAGDKAEVTALARVFGHGRALDNPCLIGSAKPNIGHLEAGAGIAGLIKVVLSLGNGILPPSIHQDLNSEIDWKNSGLKVVDAPTPWLSSLYPRRAGISCFGVGGTIAHAILEEAPVESTHLGKQDTVVLSHVFPLSTRSNGALKDAATQLANWVEKNPQVELAAIGDTLKCHRDHLSKRAAIVGSTRDEVITGLRKIASGTQDDFAFTGQYNCGAEKGVVWVFSGHGAQWAGMAIELLEKEKVFAEVIDELGIILKEELGYTARQAILEKDWSSVERVQIITFVIQLGLAAVWKKNGLQPAAIIGHSVGEVAASVVAGALDVKSAARFACRRAALYQKIAGRGGMALVRLSFEETQEKLVNFTQVSAAIAASPKATIISGDVEILDEIVNSWTHENIFVKRNPRINAAFHSFHIDALLPGIRSAAECLVPCKPNVRLYTTTLPDPRSAIDRGPEFWETNSRGIVRLLQAVEAALEDGFVSFLEISSAPIVAPSIREIADFKQRDDITVCATLRPNQPEMTSVSMALGKLFCSGVNFDWSSVYSSQGFVDLPTMPWQHRSFWLSTSMTPSGHQFGHSPNSHTLLGKAEYIQNTPPLTVWRTCLDFNSRPYPGTHPLYGVEIVPAAVLLHTLMKAGGKKDLCTLTDVKLLTPVPVDHPLELQILLQDNVLQIFSKPVDEQLDAEDLHTWTTHTIAQVDSSHEQYTPSQFDLPLLTSQCSEIWSWERVESLYRKRGIGGYGFPWQLTDLRRGDTEIIASFVTCGASWAEILDAALTVCPLLLPDDEVLRMPARIHQVKVRDQLPREYIVYVSRATEDSHFSDDACLQVYILDMKGQEIAAIKDLKFGVLENKTAKHERPADIVFTEAWRPLELLDQQEPLTQSLFFVGDQLEWLNDLFDFLSKAGVSCHFVKSLGSLHSLSNCAVVVVGSAPYTSNESVEEMSEHNSWTLIETAQALIAQNPDMKNVRLYCITQGVRASKDEASLSQSSLWGVARIIAGERPDLWGGLLDLDMETQIAKVAPQLIKLISLKTKEDVIAIGKENAYVLRLIPAAQSLETTLKAPKLQTMCHAEGTYLITGGLGSLGLEAARYLVSKGARRLILAGRHGLPSRQTWSNLHDLKVQKTINAIKELETAGVTVVPLQLDISNRDSVIKNLELNALNLPPIKGIVHAAGVFEGGLLGQINKSALHSVFKPKILGAMILHQLFPPGSVDFFVLFSSSGQFGRLSGQTCYAAANSFLDAFARYRNISGTLDTVSLGWMAWRGMGMSQSIDATMIEARSQGMEAIETTSALNAWRYCDQLPLEYAAIFSPSDSRNEKALLPVFSELSIGNKNKEADSASFKIPIENRFAWLITDIRNLVASELKMHNEGIEIKRSLIEMGVDSLMTVSLRVSLRQRYGFEFPPTLLWNNPSVHAIAQFVDHQLG